MYIYIGTYLYWTKTDPDLDGTLKEQTSIHRACILEGAILY